MLGVRGVRLGVLKPGLYAMQVRALMEAAYERVAGGRSPGRRDHDPAHRLARGAGARPVLGRSRRSRTWRPRSTRAKAETAGERIEVAIGTMIETPRAALLADEIAEVADFFSFGTNDLTQMTFGFSRDDVEGRMMAAYLEKGLLDANPFENVDTAGVGELVRIAVAAGTGDTPRPQDRRLRRARWRPRLDRLLREVGPRLRQLLALPCADRTARSRTVAARDRRGGGEEASGAGR